jgi:hypothetical protein
VPTDLLDFPVLESADLVVDRWRTSADGDNPAGPLFASGRFAATDIASPGASRSLTFDTCLRHCSTCTASRGFQCC